MDKVIISGGYWTGSSALLQVFKGQNNIFMGNHESSLFSYGQLFDTLDFNSEDSLFISDEEVFKNCLRRLKRDSTTEIPIVSSILRKLFYSIDYIRAENFEIRNGARMNFPNEYYNFKSRIQEYMHLDFNNDIIKLGELQYLVENTLNYSYDRSFNRIPEMIIFDQLISPLYFEKFNSICPDVKFIFVDRDYRDQLSDILKFSKRMLVVNNYLCLKPMKDNYYHKGGNVSIDEMLRWFVDVRVNIEDFKFNNRFNRNVLILNFEDLVNDTKNTVESVLFFLGLNPFTFKIDSLDFSESKKNIGIHKGIDLSILQTTEKMILSNGIIG